MRRDPQPIESLLVRYSAVELPISAVAQIQSQTLDQLAVDDVDLKTAFRIVNLLLTISLQKLNALAEVAA